MDMRCIACHSVFDESEIIHDQNGSELCPHCGEGNEMKEITEEEETDK